MCIKSHTASIFFIFVAKDAQKRRRKICHQITHEDKKWAFALDQAVVNKPYIQEGYSCTVEMCSIGTRMRESIAYAYMAGIWTAE